MNGGSVRAEIAINAVDSGLDKELSKVIKLQNALTKLAQEEAKLGLAQQKVSTEVAKTATQMQKQATEAAKTTGQYQKNAQAAEKARLQQQKLQQQLDKTSASASKSASSFSLSSFGLLKMGTNLSNMVNFGVRAGKAIAGLINSSSDFIETQNLFEVSLKDSTEEGEEFIHTMSTAFNLDTKTLKDAMGVFHLMGKQIGITDSKMLTFSSTLTKLAVDMSSLRNVDVETAFTKLRAGISGEAEPLRQWGIDITEVTLRQEALAHGITKSFSSMSYAEKSILRYSAIMRQTANDQQDFAKTMDSPAQVMKQLGEQFKALGREIGNVLIPYLYQLLQPLLAVVMVLKEIFAWLSTLLGFGDWLKQFDNSANSATEFTDSLNDGIGKATENAKKLKKWLGGYDELNNVTPADTSSSGSGGGVGVGIDPEFLDLITSYDNKMTSVVNKALEMKKAILGWLGFLTDADGKILGLKEGWQNFHTIVALTGGIIGTLTFTKLIKDIALLGEALKNSKLGLFLIESLSKVDFGSFGATLGGRLLYGIQEAFIGTSLFSGALDSGFLSLGEALPILLEGFLPLLEVFGGITVALLGVMEVMQGFSDFVAGDTFTGLMEILAGLALIVSGVAIAFGAWPVAIGAAIAWVVTIATTTQEFKDHFDSIKEGIEGAIEETTLIVQSIWDSVLKPIIDNVKEKLEWLYTDALQPLIKNVGDTVGAIVELVLHLWNNVFGPLIDFLISYFGPTFANIFNFIANIVSTVVSTVIKLIHSIVDVFKGIIQIIDGLITLDFQKVLDGLINIFKGVAKLFISIGLGIINGIIDIINLGTGLIWSAIKGFVNGLLTVVNKVLDAIGQDTISKMSGDNPCNISHVSFSLDSFNNGGMPSVGSLFVAGEGNNTEFVGNVGGRTNVVNQDQLEKAVYSAMVKANREDQGREVVVENYIGGNKTDSILTKRSMRYSNITGKASA